MVRNRLLPTYIFAILMAGIAIFLLALSVAIYTEMTRHLLSDHSPDGPDMAFMEGIGLAGIVIMTLTIGLMIRKKWAIWGFLSLFWLAGIAWTGFIYILFTESNSEAAFRPILAASIMLYGGLLTGILFLNNARVLALFREDKTPLAPEILPDDPQSESSTF